MRVHESIIERMQRKWGGLFRERTADDLAGYNWEQMKDNWKYVKAALLYGMSVGELEGSFARRYDDATEKLLAQYATGANNKEQE